MALDRTVADRARLEVRRALDRPLVYRALMRLLGADAAMRRWIDQTVRPQSGIRLLDLGCGPGRILSFLPPVDYLGLDRNPAYLAEARARFPAARFQQYDFDREDPPPTCAPVDLVIACGILHHLSDSAASRLFVLAFQCLRNGGRFITLDCLRVPAQHPIARLLIAADRGRFVRDHAGYVGLARRHFDLVTSSHFADMLRLPYDHICLDCRK